MSCLQCCLFNIYLTIYTAECQASKVTAAPVPLNVTLEGEVNGGQNWQRHLAGNVWTVQERLSVCLSKYKSTGRFKKSPHMTRIVSLFTKGAPDCSKTLTAHTVASLPLWRRTCFDTSRVTSAYKIHSYVRILWIALYISMDLYILWTVHRDTHKWERPKTCTLLLILLWIVDRASLYNLF